jgi:hypothetical protein
MASGPGGKIYSVPGFETEYDVMSDQRSKNFMNVDCAYNESDNLISYELSEYSDGNNSQSDKILKLKYNLRTKKVE